MIEQKKIKKENLGQFFDALKNSGKTMIAPRKNGEKVLFAYTDSFSQVAVDYVQTTLSAKSVVFPRTEELFSYVYEGKNIKINPERDNLSDVVVFGLHPCDASSFDYMSSFFTKENPDSHYSKRRERTALISFACKTGDEYCFCTSTGGRPDDTKGSDLMLTDMGTYFYADIITDKGVDMYNKAQALFEETPVVDKKEFVANIPIKFNLDNVRQKINNVYNENFWVEESLACLGCGACAFSCPTCTCFDIQEENNPYDGKRLRNWDACAIGIFTQHASGHNPRDVQSQRWRHRILHKFEYSVRTLDTVSCVGCGRCIRVCPGGMNIIEQVIQIDN